MQSAENMIYLASKSPRRRELLRQIGVEFELLQLRSDGRRGMDVTEEVLRGETPEVYVARVAHEKAHFALRMVRLRNMPPRLVLSADTTVTFDGRILYHPRNFSLEHPFEEGTSVIDPRVTVLEIKYDHRAPVWLTKAIGERGLKIVRMSKYCSAVDKHFFGSQNT